MEVVPDRTAGTLLPIIQQPTLPGTTIHSDEWSAYRHVSTLPNIQRHRMVNHSLHFVAPNGVHTQNVESYWSCAKLKFKRMKGIRADQLPSYLDEFLWRKRFGKMPSEAMENIMEHITELTPLISCHRQNPCTTS